jgi:serine/threonine-protein kinase
VDEVRLTGRLDHPNIVPLHDVGCDDRGRFYFVMKKLDGETLEAIIERLRDGDPTTHQRFPIPVRVEIFLGVLRAIEFAHAQRIVHRDIKPSNIMIGRYGEVVVMDWGIAKRLDDDLSEALDAAVPPTDEVPAGNVARRNFRTRVGTLLGTPAYMAPEQARGDNHLVDERSDIYSLCVVLYELLTLRHYLEDATDLPALLDGVRTRVAPPAGTSQNPHQPGVPMELSFFVERGMAKQREGRYASAGEMLDALHRVMGGTFPVSCPVTLMKRGVAGLARTIDSHPGAMVLGLGGTLLASIAGIVGLALHFLG